MKKIQQPNKFEIAVLQIMIAIGGLSMGYFLFSLFNPSNIGHPILYWILLSGILYNCVKLLLEWYHYFHIDIPTIPDNSKSYTVDIFTTFCAGEPYEMITTTLRAIQAINYPHTTYLCDESNDPYLKNFCNEIGVKHVTRTIKIDAKAGNINNALAISKGELCLILDPDHEPIPEFLDHVVPYFLDPKIGYVQVPQVYKNLEETIIAKGAAQQTFQFYGPIMMTMNCYGTVQAIGANCTFRRSALESIGGHAAGLSEDMHTSMKLHAKGWKSVYAPVIVARGLVPSTLSSYYKQQLKWSRGTLDLLLNVYPKLFKYFTWRQKIHYGFLPLHYLNGLIYFINFLIPIVCLFSGIIPLKYDLLSFTYIVLPLYASMLLIRHYVQKWVMEEKERGFHFVGGLLLIGTWWIYMLGLIFTLIGKKVPYDPTPKDGRDENNWSLNIPNIVVAFVSIAAIFYGIHRDPNPYTYIMAFLAGINAMIMLFTVVASRQSHVRVLRKKFKFIHVPLVQYGKVKSTLWTFRHNLYYFLRIGALPMLLITIAILLFFITDNVFSKYLNSTNIVLQKKEREIYSGIYYPAAIGGYSSLHQIEKLQKEKNIHFNIVSLYIPWGTENKCYLPMSYLDSVASAKSYPMVTWEPWKSLFNLKPASLTAKENKIFNEITNGTFDTYIDSIATQVSNFKHPIFIRFAHEFDNPFYPWSATGGNSSTDFKEAWKYVYLRFKALGASNAIWVWNPWKPEAVEAYFPGEEYVDWIGVTCLNYGTHNPDKKWYSFDSLYAPFHKKKIFTSGIPVMIAEMGSLNSELNQEKWHLNAFQSIKNKFKEINGYVLFNSGYDINLPHPSTDSKLNWTLSATDTLYTSLQYNSKENFVSDTKKLPASAAFPKYKSTASTSENLSYKGVNYNKGISWYKNYHTLTRKEIEKDFDEMQEIGLSAIKRIGPDIYEENIFNVAEEKKIIIYYSFTIPEPSLIYLKNNTLDELQEKILDHVQLRKEEKSIVSWGISTFSPDGFKQFNDKPQLFISEEKYTNWINNLITEIKKIDNTRPVFLDVSLKNNSTQNIIIAKLNIPAADIFGLITSNDSIIKEKNLPSAIQYFYSNSNSKNLKSSASSSNKYFFSEWQNLRNKDFISFNGLLDFEGRKKEEFYHAKNLIFGNKNEYNLPPLKILRPAQPLTAGKWNDFNCLIYNNGGWEIAKYGNFGYTFEWHLIKYDTLGTAVSMQHIGSGPKIGIKIPVNYKDYELYLTGHKNDQVQIARSKINTPLFLADTLF